MLTKMIVCIVVLSIIVLWKTYRRPIYGDYVQVPTYNISKSIDWLLLNDPKAKWDIMKSVWKKLEDAAWRKAINDCTKRCVRSVEAD